MKTPQRDTRAHAPHGNGLDGNAGHKGAGLERDQRLAVRHGAFRENQNLRPLSVCPSASNNGGENAHEWGGARVSGRNMTPNKEREFEKRKGGVGR